MTPRHPNSKKWTTLPSELITQMEQVFSDGFKEHAANGKFVVEGRIYPSELMFRVGYLETGRIRQANFELSIDFSAANKNALQQIHFLMDASASLVEQYFELGSLEEFPLDWFKFTIEKQDVYFKTSTVNTQLETQADALLGEYSDDLVKGSDEDLEKDAVVTMLGLGDTDEDPSEPTEH